MNAFLDFYLYREHLIISLSINSNGSTRRGLGIKHLLSLSHRRITIKSQSSTVLTSFFNKYIRPYYVLGSQCVDNNAAFYDRCIRADPFHINQRLSPHFGVSHSQSTGGNHIRIGFPKCVKRTLCAAHMPPIIL